jgi:hypothetical protein
MSRCHPSVAVGVCCGRPGPRSRLQRLERWARLLVVTVLLPFLPTVLGDGTRATRLGNPDLWGRVPCTTLSGSGAFVGQSEECGDSLHVMRGQLLQHFLITYSLAEGRDDGVGNR